MNGGKPTYAQLWGSKGWSLMDIWKQGETKLNANELSVIWNGYPIHRATAEVALREYNHIFETTYTLDQVSIPTF